MTTTTTSAQRRLFITLPPWCSYVGVLCDTVTGSLTYASVLSITLTNSSLVGTLPSSIRYLTSLQFLYMDQNGLNGSIPSTIGYLKALQQIDFSYNEMSGSVPNSIGSVVSLNYFFAFVNHYTGTIPSSIGTLSLLQYLDLDTNLLTGTIPSSFSKLSLMQYFNMTNNYLTMGSLSTVPVNTFSNYTLSINPLTSAFDLTKNCLAFSYHQIQVTPTHCQPTPSKL